MTMNRPNIILIMSEQQHADSIGALGAFAWHLDADMHPDNFIGDTA